MNICAVIPAFNEEKTISNIVKQTKRYINAVIVVDNNSIDDTVYAAIISGAIVVTCRENGVGITQYTGLQYAVAEGFE